MQVDDLPTVMAIERASYEFPWTEGIFRDCLRNHYHCFVYEVVSDIHAYAVMTIGVDECHILNVCVSEVSRKHGLGSYMVGDGKKDKEAACATNIAIHMS